MGQTDGMPKTCNVAYWDDRTVNNEVIDKHIV